MRKIKRGDTVVVITGKDKGRTGSVLSVSADDRAIVSGVRIVKRHTKPVPAMNIQGGIVSKEAPIHISNIALLNPKTGKADRVGFRILEDGKKIRYFKSSGEPTESQQQA